jgi:phosphoribosylglycinamide formyltransferase-1
VKRPRLGVLVSGGGTTLQNFLDEAAAGRLRATVAVVVASDPGCTALDRARRAGVPAVAVPWKGAAGRAAFDRGIDAALREHEADLVALAGFLRLWRFPPRWKGRVLNIHPALLPAFGGKGMYGMRVHEAVAASGVKVTGCTVHFADHAYDRGPVLLQRTCPVRFEDSAEAIRARVFEEEKQAYPEAVNLVADGRAKVVGGRVRVR